MPIKSKGFDFSKGPAKGDNPKGFTAQTVNGTAKACGGGWNDQWDWGDLPQVDSSKPLHWGNRTGE